MHVLAISGTQSNKFNVQAKAGKVAILAKEKRGMTSSCSSVWSPASMRALQAGPTFPEIGLWMPSMLGSGRVDQA